jgi:hemoglobin-like flavoprotein
MSTPSGSAESSLNVNLLLSTFQKIEPQAEEFATSFYQILFDKYPQTERLFSATNMQQQRIKLIQSLQLVIANIHSTEDLNNILKALGARHVEYGAVLTDYPLIGDSLLQALEKHLNRDWNEEVKQTWTAAYQMIAEMMMVGAQEVHAHLDLNNNAAEKKTDFKSNTAVGHTTISRPDSIFVKLIPWAIVGMAAVCGYLVWALMNQPDVSPPSPLEKPIPNTNR